MKFLRETLAFRASIIFAVGVMAAVGAAPAASATDIGPSERSELYEWYVERGVDPFTANGLVEGISQGQMPDSADENAHPIEVAVTQEDNWLVTTRTFADGSLTESRLEQPAVVVSGNIAPFSVGGCTGSSSGSGYINYYGCVVQQDAGYLVVNFRADYFRASGGAGITQVHSPYAYALGGTAATPSLTITSAYSSGSTPAKARASTVYVTALTSKQVHLYLNVTSAQAWSTSTGF